MITISPGQKMAMLAAIIDSSQDGIISKNLNGTITSWNKGAEAMFGYTEQEAIGQHISLIIPEDRLQEEDMIISKLRRGERVEHYHTIRRTKSGKHLHISLSISPMLDEEGNVIGASKIARDITRQKETDDLITQYVQRLEVLNAVGKTLAAELNIQKILQKTTDATTRLSGAAFGAFFYNKTDAKGESLVLSAISGAPKEAFEKLEMPRKTPLFDITFSGRGTVRSDDITKDTRSGKNPPHKGMPPGHLPIVSYLAVPIFAHTGVVIGGLLLGHPAVGRFKEEHEILVEAIASQAGIALENAKLYQEVQNLSNKKDEFIGFASHELKTPLATISGYIQLMEESAELSQQALPKVKKQVSRLSNIISDLLDISKIQAGKFELNKTSTTLSALLKENIESAKHLSAGHDIEFDLPSEEIILEVDTTKIGQVMANIFSNAFKYSPSSNKVALSAERYGNEVKISIRDWGIGIAREHLRDIFTQFYRINDDDNKAQGLGLGLFLCKEFVEAHHGEIWAESEAGKGTVIHLTLPIKLIKQ